MTFWDTVADTPDAPANMCHLSPLVMSSYLHPLIATHPARLIDLGCGIGRLTREVAERLPGSTVYGIDSSAPMLRRARAETTEPNVRYVQSDGRRLPETVNLVDAAWSVLMFQHVPDSIVRGYISQFAPRIVRGGMVLFQFVHEGDFGPLAYPRSPRLVAEWMAMAGFANIELITGIGEDCWTWARGTAS